MKLNSAHPFFLQMAATAVLALLLPALSGCSSKPSRNANTKPAEPAQNSAHVDFDLNCVSDRLHNPPVPFHYSYNWNGGDRYVHQEVDVTPQTLDGTIKSNNSGNDMTTPLHAARSDADAWRIAVESLNFGIGGLAPGFALVRNGTGSVREGTESVNGYDAIKYSIDTTRGDASDQALYGMTLGAGGFMKGTVWATAQGCPVKISLMTKSTGLAARPKITTRKPSSRNSPPAGFAILV